MSITVSKPDAYLTRIISRYTNLTEKTKEKISNYNKEVEQYKKNTLEYGKLFENYDKQHALHELETDEEKKKELEKELSEMEKKIVDYETILDNEPKHSEEERSNAVLYLEKVIKLINLFKKTISEPKNLNIYFIELLTRLDSDKILYKNRLIFLDEFQKHLDDKNIIMGIIDALKNRQDLIEIYNIKSEIIENQHLDVDMSLSVYVHKKPENFINGWVTKTISDIYNSKLNNFIYKYCVYSYHEYLKEEINNVKKDSCDKYQILYTILNNLNNYNEPNLNNFPPMQNGLGEEDLT